MTASPAELLDRSSGSGMRNIKVAILLVDLKSSRSARVNCGNIVHREVIPHAPCSRNSLDGSYGIYRIPSDRPGVADFQQPLNYGSIPWSFNRILTCYPVHSPREAATETCLGCIFHGTNLPELGHSPRNPRLTSEAKALIQTGRLSSGGSCLSSSAMNQISVAVMFPFHALFGLANPPGV